MSDAVHVQSAKPAAAARAGAGRVLQRKCACGRETGPSGECAACRRKRLQRKGNGAGDATNDALGVTPAVQHVLQAPGRSLDRTTREAMEHHFGHDFSQVQVHTGAQAAASARRVNALAYTVGQHVVFGARQFDPHTREDGDCWRMNWRMSCNSAMRAVPPATWLWLATAGSVRPTPRRRPSPAVGRLPSGSRARRR
ncbi:MAG: DUF4157 domain-containing protein [Anaerolineales bacterium]|nr:DUF4157 domain-containing protein [Anaerolineales bacterium]